jgi:hypothetical protein
MGKIVTIETGYTTSGCVEPVIKYACPVEGEDSLGP